MLQTKNFTHEKTGMVFTIQALTPRLATQVNAEMLRGDGLGMTVQFGADGSRRVNIAAIQAGNMRAAIKLCTNLQVVDGGGLKAMTPKDREEFIGGSDAVIEYILENAKALHEENESAFRADEKNS